MVVNIKGPGYRDEIYGSGFIPHHPSWAAQPYLVSRGWFWSPSWNIKSCLWRYYQTLHILSWIKYFSRLLSTLERIREKSFHTIATDSIYFCFVFFLCLFVDVIWIKFYPSRHVRKSWKFCFGFTGACVCVYDIFDGASLRISLVAPCLRSLLLSCRVGKIFIRNLLFPHLITIYLLERIIFIAQNGLRYAKCRRWLCDFLVLRVDCVRILSFCLGSLRFVGALLLYVSLGKTQNAYLA